MRDYARLYSELLVDLDLQAPYSTHITSDMSTDMAARVSLANSFFKKLAPFGGAAEPDIAALKKFKAVNASLPADSYEFSAENEAESCFWDYFCNHLNSCIGPSVDGSFDLDSIREGMGVGPGAAQRADATSFHSKLFEGEMSYTDPALIPYYRAALVETGLWADAERRRFEEYGFTKVRGGKVFFATKNAEISRTCCTEPNLNMLVQKAVGTFLEKRLEWYFGIRLSTQPDFNRELVRIGSIDGSFGSIDLVSASDSIGYHMLCRALRDSFLKGVLRMSRCNTAVLPDGSEVVLRMISTMGNGFTFPLQTVIFSSAVRAVYDLMGFPCVSSKTQFGVYGDDIVVRRETYQFLIKMLNKLGFQVNVGKSFNDGVFRESCGHDYCRGVNIRGVYVKSLEIPQEVYSLVNRLVRWGVLHERPLTSTVRLLQTWARDLRVPPSESDDAGFKVPFRATRPKVDEKYWFKYRCYQRKVKRASVGELDDPDNVPFNPEGIGVSFLGGYIRRRDYVLTSSDDTAWKHDWSASVTIRDRIGARARYKVVTRALPWWDWWRPDSKQVSTASPSSEGYEWRVDLTIDSRSAWESAAVALFPNRE